MRTLLRAVIDPELGDNIVDLGMAGDIRIADGTVTIGVKLTIRGCPCAPRSKRTSERDSRCTRGCAR